MFPTRIFETGTQRRILRVLAETNRRYTIDELAAAVHRSPSTVSRALSEADRYPFVERSTVPGSKRYVYALDAEHEYASAIREFFAVECRRERADGTVPVGVWNLLEDVTDGLESVEGFVEAYLYGAYARGDYYAGGDVEVLVVVDEAVDGAVLDAEDALLGFHDADPPVRSQVLAADPGTVEGGSPPRSAVLEGPMEPADRPIALSGGT